MSQTQHGRTPGEAQNQEERHPHSPYWRQAHHHWYFWVAMLLMLVAIVNYVMTEDLSLVPRNQPQQSRPNVDGK